MVQYKRYTNTRRIMY